MNLAFDDGRRIEPDLFSELLSLAGIIIARWWLVVFAVIVAVLTAYLIFVATPSRYEASLLISLDRTSQNVPRGTQEPQLPLDAAYVDSQVELLRSDGLYRRVIGPEGLDEAMLENLDLGLLSGLRAGARERLGLETDEPVTERARLGRDLRRVRANADVDRIGQSNVIRVSFASRDSALSVAFARRIADEYLQLQVEANAAAARQSSVWLQQQLAELEEQILTTEAELEAKRGAVAGPADTSELRSLEAAARTFRSLQERLLEEYFETVQRQSLPFAHAHVISDPVEPHERSWPRFAPIIGLGSLVGLVVGCLLALGAHRLQR
jgi:uncharacterized protein involved in exopolysaccharide biosynthesis